MALFVVRVVERFYMETLKWKLKQDNGILSKNFDSFGSDDGSDILELALKSYGVNNIEDFLCPKEKHCFNPFLMKNMFEAINLFDEFITDTNYKEKAILLKVDPDVDGFTSSSIMWQFIKLIDPDRKIELVFNYEKTHGLKAFNIEHPENIGLIIIPDASFESDDYDDIKALEIPIIILDHHIISDEHIHEYALVVNCTDGQYPNPTLTGAGVVYKFCRAFCDVFGENFKLSKHLPDQWLDLVSLGLIADSADARDLETRYYMLRGMEDEACLNPLINALVAIKKEENSMHLGRTIITMGWFIAPLINGCIRYGKPEEQMMTFRAMCGEQEEILYQPRRKVATDPLPDKVIHTLAQEAARVCKNVKTRQDNEVKRYITSLEEKIEAKGLDKNRVLFIDGSDVLKKKTVTGLVANKLSSKYMRPCVLLKSFTDTSFGGSGRAYEYGNMEDFRSFLLGTNTFESCSGHPNAFGLELKKSNLEDAIRICNETLPEGAMETIYKVDFQIAADDLTPSAVSSIAQRHMLFGNGVPSPEFAITDIEIPAKKINVLADRTIHFNYKKVDYVLKYPRGGVYDKLTLHDRRILGANTKKLKMNLIGHFTLEEISGKITPVVKFKDGYFDSFEVEGTELEDRVITTIEKVKHKIDFDDVLYDLPSSVKMKKVEDDSMDESKMREEIKKKRMLDIDDDFIF